jgi:quercetin dioxygenase-like cupin family protein
MKVTGYVKLISSVDSNSNSNSILEMNILPGEKTPWHYHTLFSETFTILKGTLEVGRGKNVLQFKQGDVVTIKPNEKHYYHNISKEECIVTTAIDPGSKNFENALLILKGLANDGLATRGGTPKRFTDLVLFVHLTNSRMIGIQKVAEPLFKFFANAAIKRGQLTKLTQKYCNLTQ